MYHDRRWTNDHAIDRHDFYNLAGPCEPVVSKLGRLVENRVVMSDAVLLAHTETDWVAYGPRIVNGNDG